MCEHAFILAEIFVETIRLSLLRIGTTIFRRMLPQFRKSNESVRSISCDDLYSSFNSTLINGKGTYPGGPSNVSLAVVNVQHNKR